jgi:Arc/MetJ-type ribon-helix-helix transcriptional regulator
MQHAATTTSGNILSARVSREELRAFDALIGAHGFRSRSDALRAMIRLAAGFLEVSREDGAALSELQHELHKIGVNVNQIALAANRRQVPLMQAQWQGLNDLRAVLPSVRTLLKQMVDEHRRRGTALFRAVVAEVDHG